MSISPKSQNKILIIEDEVAIAAMYKFKLEHSGYEVMCVHNGKDGLALAKQSNPSLVLLDLRMPVMSGDEILARMRATEWGSLPRVIILTNISKDEAPSRLRFLNVDRYIVKAHHTPAQIVDIVREVLGEERPVYK